MMDIKTVIRQRRTIRRFLPIPIEMQELLDIVSLARLYASGANQQPIRFALVTDQYKLDRIFDTLHWAAYLPRFQINYDERPMAYIVLTSKKRDCRFDLGAAATTLMLAAEGAGLASCCLGSFDRNALCDVLSLNNGLEPQLVVALGYPAQKSRIVDYSGDIKYYESDDGCLCVPKRTLDDVLIIC